MIRATFAARLHRQEYSMSKILAALVFTAASSILVAHTSYAASAGTLSFASATGATFQNARTYDFPVARVGGSTGAAGAVCTAVSGTAVLGKDFTMASTSLQWANGNASTLNCVVAVSDAAPFTGERTFTLELTSVTGASLGTTVKQTVSIHGNQGCGSVEFSAANYSVAQTAGSITLTVNRTGGSAKGAYVWYSTANGTANGGANYMPTYGSLTWADGDSSPKTISVKIINSAASTAGKTFAIALAHPQDAVLGTHTSAIVTIGGAQSVATGGAATLAWSAPTDDTNGAPVATLAGYSIAYGTSESAMTKAVSVSGANTTNYEVAGLANGTWYFKVAAIAADGAQGPYSSIGSKTIN